MSFFKKVNRELKKAEKDVRKFIKGSDDSDNENTDATCSSENTENLQQIPEGNILAPQETQTTSHESVTTPQETQTTSHETPTISQETPTTPQENPSLHSQLIPVDTVYKVIDQYLQQQMPRNLDQPTSPNDNKMNKNFPLIIIDKTSKSFPPEMTVEMFFAMHDREWDEYKKECEETTELVDYEVGELTRRCDEVNRIQREIDMEKWRQEPIKDCPASQDVEEMLNEINLLETVHEYDLNFNFEDEILDKLKEEKANEFRVGIKENKDYRGLLDVSLIDPNREFYDTKSIRHGHSLYLRLSQPPKYHDKIYSVLTKQLNFVVKEVRMECIDDVTTAIKEFFKSCSENNSEETSAGDKKYGDCLLFMIVTDGYVDSNGIEWIYCGSTDEDVINPSSLWRLIDSEQPDLFKEKPKLIFQLADIKKESGKMSRDDGSGLAMVHSVPRTDMKMLPNMINFCIVSAIPQGFSQCSTIKLAEFFVDQLFKKFQAFRSGKNEIQDNIELFALLTEINQELTKVSDQGIYVLSSLTKVFEFTQKYENKWIF